MFVHDIDQALCAGDFCALMELTEMTDFETMLTNDVESTYEQCTDSTVGAVFPQLESQLVVKHAKLITQLEKEISDYPLHVCCSCEQLHQRKSVTRVNISDNLGSEVWERLKSFILQQNPSACDMFMCKYCKPLIRNNKLPARCVLNGLELDPVPPELAMFFLPLPLNKTLETLDQVQPTSDVKTALPNPELFIIVNGKPTKRNIVWRTLVDVNAVKSAIQTLKQTNWLYVDVDDASVDEAATKVIEVVRNASSTMLEKASVDDIQGFQAFTIRNLDNKLSTDSDTEQYKLLSVKEDPIDNRQQYLDVMCFSITLSHWKVC